MHGQRTCGLESNVRQRLYEDVVAVWRSRGYTMVTAKPPALTGSCLKCGAAACGRHYEIYTARVYSQSWNAKEYVSLSASYRQGRNFYAPTGKIQDFYCRQCAAKICAWYLLKPVAVLALLTIWIAFVLFGLREGWENADYHPWWLGAIQVLWGIAAAILFLGVFIGGFIIHFIWVIAKEVVVRPFAFSPTEAIEWRMKKMRGFLRGGEYICGQLVGNEGDTDAFTSKEWAKLRA